MEQGTFAKLRSGGRYVENLDISEQSNKSEEEKSTESRLVDQPTSRTVDSEAEQEQERSSSDRATFHYYFAAIGYRLLMLQLGAVLIVGSLPAFRCKCLPMHVYTMRLF